MKSGSWGAVLGLCGLIAGPLAAQEWTLDEPAGAGAAATVCVAREENAPDAPGPCFRLGCSDGAPLHFELTRLASEAQMPDRLAATIRVDGRAAGLLLFGGAAGGASVEGAGKGTGGGVVTLAAPFDPQGQRDLIARLRGGSRAVVSLQLPGGARDLPLSLRGSSKALGAVLRACPPPQAPPPDPAATVLDRIVRDCGGLGGTVAVEPGFERREDLDGDGRKDVVIDYAAAVCSKMASLYCGSGGCTAAFFLARDEGFERIFEGVIRGYSAQPGGLLALDLHGTACGLYGFEACRKVFRIGDDSFALVQELAGAEAEAAMAADRAATAGTAAAGGAGAEAGREADSNAGAGLAAAPGPASGATLMWTAGGAGTPPAAAGEPTSQQAAAPASPAAGTD